MNSSPFTGNSANSGGGIYTYGGFLTVNNSAFTGDSSGDGDDIHNGATLTVNYGTAGFNGTLVVGNTATATLPTPAISPAI